MNFTPCGIISFVAKYHFMVKTRHFWWFQNWRRVFQRPSPCDRLGLRFLCFHKRCSSSKVTWHECMKVPLCQKSWKKQTFQSWRLDGRRNGSRVKVIVDCGKHTIHLQIEIQINSNRQLHKPSNFGSHLIAFAYSDLDPCLMWHIVTLVNPIDCLRDQPMPQFIDWLCLVNLNTFPIPSWWMKISWCVLICWGRLTFHLDTTLRRLEALQRLLCIWLSKPCPSSRRSATGTVCVVLSRQIFVGHKDP